MHASAALFTLSVCTGFVSSYGFLPCCVLATVSAPFGVGFVGICVVCQPFIQAICYQQVSFSMLALHVIMISLALLGVYLGHAYQEITDCPAPGRHTALAYVPPEICLAVVTNLFSLVGVFFLGAKVKAWRASRASFSLRSNQVQPIVPLPTSARNTTIGNLSRSIAVVPDDSSNVEDESVISTEDEHENETQLAVAEETEAQGSPGSGDLPDLVKDF